MADNSTKITTINLLPSQVWPYSRQHTEQLEKSMVSIASSMESGCEVFLTIDRDSTMIYVYHGDEMIYEEAIVSYDDAVATVGKIYLCYLGELGEKEGCYGTGHTRQELEDDMYDREQELCDAMEDFLEVAVEGMFDAYFGKDADACQDMVDSMCRILALRYGISIRRPEFQYDKDGNESYTEFPYDELIEEEDNIPE